MADNRLSIVAVGAHLDDCWLGMGGVALKAARHGHRVTMIQAVSVYGAWPVVGGREAEIKPVLQRLADDHGVALITLGHDYMRLVHGPDLIGQIARVLAEVRPDILFCQWEDDSNQDHVALGGAARVAALHGQCFLPAGTFRPPAEVYHYRGDSQARNFTPDTFVEIATELNDLLELAATFDAIYAAGPGGGKGYLPRYTLTDHRDDDRQVQLTLHTVQKFANCVTDGCRCGVRYAEGFRAYKTGPVGHQLLATI
jgi:LmbE family N-acetylglucosaminyl deacetylase